MSEQPLPQMTGKEINSILTNLSLQPIERELFDSLMSKYGDRYKRTLLWAHGNPDAYAAPQTEDERKQVSYLRAVSAICNANVTAGLQRLQLECNHQARVALANSYALYRMFSEAFEPAVRGDSGAKNTLIHAIAEARRNVIGMQAMENSKPEADPAPASSNPPPFAPSKQENSSPRHPQSSGAPLPKHQSGTRSANSGTSSNGVVRNFGPSKHVYGGSGAICFQVSLPDPNGEHPPVWGIHIEGAKGANRVYQWQDKINLRFNEGELPFFLGVLFGYLPKFEGNSHGPKNDKFFSIENQGDKFFVKVGQGSKENLKCVSVPMTLGDAFWVACIFVKVLMQSTALSESMVMHIVKIMCEQRNGVSRDKHFSQRNAA